MQNKIQNFVNHPLLQSLIIKFRSHKESGLKKPHSNSVDSGIQILWNDSCGLPLSVQFSWQDTIGRDMESSSLLSSQCCLTFPTYSQIS